jgi:hypothetical protein
MVASEEGDPLRFRLWHQEMRNLLIGQGLQGFRESAVLKHFKAVHPDEVKAYLELLLKEDKVQKFKYKTHVYWRATINLLDSDV